MDIQNTHITIGKSKSLQNGENRKSDHTLNSILMQGSRQIGEHAHTHAQVYTHTYTHRFGRVTGSCTIIRGRHVTLGEQKQRTS